MITAFLHVLVVDVVITCISATWSPAQICMTTQHKEHFMYYTDLLVHVLCQI